MIDKSKINIDWISQVSKQNRKADKILVEKVIRALLLLEGLVVHEIPFVFKGGTALMLHPYIRNKVINNLGQITVQ